MGQPIVKMWDLTDPTNGTYNLGSSNPRRLAYFAGGVPAAGGPVGTEIGTVSAPRLKFTRTQAGGWSIAEPVVFEMQADNTGAVSPAQDLRLKIQDPDQADRDANRIRTNLSEDLFPGSGEKWVTRFALSNAFVVPTSINVNNINLGTADGSGGVPLGTASGENAMTADGVSLSSTRWIDLPYDVNDGGYLLDTLIKTYGGGLAGNDGTAGKVLIQNGVNPYFWALNFYLYLAIKPRSTALAGNHMGWGFRLNLVWPGT